MLAASPLPCLFSSSKLTLAFVSLTVNLLQNMLRDCDAGAGKTSQSGGAEDALANLTQPTSCLQILDFLFKQVLFID